MVILLTAVIVLSFMLILIAAFTYIVTYSPDCAASEQYYHLTEDEPTQELINDHEKFLKIKKDNPFIFEIPVLDRDTRIHCFDNNGEVENTNEAVVVDSISSQLETIFSRTDRSVSDENLVV